MRIASKATKGKGKRWKRGESSGTNPTVTKHRELAKSMSISSIDKPQSVSKSHLTQDIVAHHNAIQMKNLCLENDDSESKHLSMEDNDRCSSIASFASEWSNCTNDTFSKFLNNWKSHSALHKEMLAVLSAVTETLQKNGGNETETEYFAALMTVLENVEHDEALTAVIALINMVLKRLPQSVLRLKFSETIKIFVEYLSRYVNSENGVLIRSLCNCIGTLLKNQEMVIWQLPSTQMIYQTILSLTTHSKPRIRKCIHRNITFILKYGNVNCNNDMICHPIAGLTCEFCIRKIEGTDINENMNAVLYMISLIKDIFPVLSQNHIRKCSETLLRVMTLGNAHIVANSFNAFSELFRNRPHKQRLSPEINAQIISALYDYHPNINDVQQICLWLRVMREAFVNLYYINSQLCFNNLPKLYSIIVPCYLSDSTQVHYQITDTLNTIYSNCIEPSLIEIGKELFEKLYSNFNDALKYQYCNSWSSVFNVISHYFNGTYSDICASLLSTLADMRDDSNCQFVKELDLTFARAIQQLGPNIVIDACNFDLSDDNDFARSWLLPLLRDNINCCTLSLFTDRFFPNTITLNKRVKYYESEGRIADAKTCSVLIEQIWSLFPAFCIKPIDFNVSFKTIARSLGTILDGNDEIRIHVLKGLRNLINKNSDDVNIRNELNRYAKNFIPILLNIYTVQPQPNQKNLYLAVYHTINLYISITDKRFLTSVYDKIKERYTNSDDKYLSLSMLDLMILFIPFLSKSELTQLYQNVALPSIENTKYNANQKKGYRIIEEIYRNESNDCKEFSQQNLRNVLNILSETLPKCAASSLSALLRTLRLIIEINSDDIFNQFINLFPSILIPIIKCLLISSRRVETSARLLLISMANAVKISKDNGHFEFIENIITLKDKDDDDYLSSAGILSLKHLYVAFKDEIPNTLRRKIIENVLLSLRKNHRQSVQSSIDFINCLIRYSSVEQLSPFLELLIQSLTDINQYQQKHFRFKVKEIIIKLIRKFGYIIISKMIPESYSKMLRNIRKVETRKKNKSQDESQSDDNKSRIKIDDVFGEVLRDSDDDLSGDTEEENVSKVSKKSKLSERSKYWIEEPLEDDDVLDLMSPKSMKSVLSANPNKTVKKKQHFEMSDDGRLIIDINEGRGMKRTINEANEEDDDNLDVTSTVKSSVYQHGGRGIHRSIDNRSKVPGEEYRARKAGGDMKRKGKPDPFAYVPLNHGSLNRRKKVNFKGQFNNLVKAAKKGADRGNRIKKRKNKKQKIV